MSAVREEFWRLDEVLVWINCREDQEAGARWLSAQIDKIGSLRLLTRQVSLETLFDNRAEIARLETELRDLTRELHAKCRDGTLRAMRYTSHFEAPEAIPAHAWVHLQFSELDMESGLRDGYVSGGDSDLFRVLFVRADVLVAWPPKSSSSHGPEPVERNRAVEGIEALIAEGRLTRERLELPGPKGGVKDELAVLLRCKKTTARNAKAEFLKRPLSQ